MKYPQIHQKRRVETIIHYNRSLQRDAVYFYVGDHGTKNNPLHVYRCMDDDDDLESRVVLHKVFKQPSFAKSRRVKEYCFVDIR